MAAEVKTEIKTEVKEETTEEAPAVEEEVKNGVKEENGDATNETAASQDDASKAKKVHPSGKTMIVTNLPVDMLFSYEDELKNLFSKYGPITYIKRGGVPISYDTVQPTLSAYVNFENTESSEQALAERGTILGGNPIDIDILRAGEHTVVISNLPYVIAKECLYKLLSPCGAIKDIVKIPARPTAFVDFEDEEGAKKALSLNGCLLINNLQVIIQRRGGPDNTPKKPKKPMTGNKRPNPSGMKRGGRGGMGRGGGRNQQMGGGGYQSWDGGHQMGFRGGHRGNYGGNNGGMNYNWGNSNFRDNNMDERPYKRRKQNDWMYQY